MFFCKIGLRHLLLQSKVVSNSRAKLTTNFNFTFRSNVYDFSVHDWHFCQIYGKRVPISEQSAIYKKLHFPRLAKDRFQKWRFTSAEIVVRTTCVKMSGDNVDGKVTPNSKNVSLPMSRVKLIMKSSPDVSNINQEALFLTTKATELFVQHLARSSYKNGPGKGKKTLSYSDLANAAEETDNFQFLIDILPKKILASDYLKSLEERGEEDDI